METESWKDYLRVIYFITGKAIIGYLKTKRHIQSYNKKKKLSWMILFCTLGKPGICHSFRNYKICF